MRYSRVSINNSTREQTRRFFDLGSNEIPFEIWWASDDRVSPSFARHYDTCKYAHMTAPWRVQRRVHIHARQRIHKLAVPSLYAKERDRGGSRNGTRIHINSLTRFLRKSSMARCAESVSFTKISDLFSWKLLCDDKPYWTPATSAAISLSLNSGFSLSHVPLVKAHTADVLVG